AQGQKLDETARCLAGENVALSGTMNLRVDLRTQGQPAELLQNLKGTVSADVRNGQVKKFALIGNILSMQNVVAVVEQGGPKLGAEGFPFRQLAAKGRFDKGRFVLEEGVFHSNAVGLGANGWISLTDFQTGLTVLVAPLALLDEGVRKIPLVGYVVGGTFTSLPVAVSGDIRDPRVIPLGPRAITSELSGLVTRTFSLPGKVVDPAK
ncbi:MAG: AsmA-like C-terminal domain-containing protein, partial [Betaproteobacteria bacterium]|nr:AsmA-like C-terminal domain-containing protein [Betaproteobacteria bacterium]